MVDRVKPRVMVHVFVHGSVHGSVHGGLPCIFPSTRGTLGFFLNHVLRLRLIECTLHNVLLEHGGLLRASI